MKRQPSRAPSPTPTAFSGISNYRNDSYRSVRDKPAVPAVPTVDYRLVSRTHYDELGRYLAAYLAKCPFNQKSFDLRFSDFFPLHLRSSAQLSFHRKTKAYATYHSAIPRAVH